MGVYMKNYICPVCGYPQLEKPAWELETGTPSFDICPCCGCEFGYHDATPVAGNNYRRNWIKQGAVWFRSELRPTDWNLKHQLRCINVDLDSFAE
jgi:hypothetical protein